MILLENSKIEDGTRQLKIIYSAAGIDNYKQNNPVVKTRAVNIDLGREAGSTKPFN